MTFVHEVLRKKDNTVWSVSPIDTVFDAIASMAEHEVGALPVVQEGQVIGIVSERDYARKVILKDKSSKLTRVSEIMTREVVHVDTHRSVDHCIRLMSDHHIRHLPVIESGVMVGMLSLRDLFARVIDDQATTIDHLEHYIRGEV